MVLSAVYGYLLSVSVRVTPSVVYGSSRVLDTSKESPTVDVAYTLLPLRDAMNYPMSSNPSQLPTAWTLCSGDEVVLTDHDGERVYDPLGESEDTMVEKLQYYQRFQTRYEFARAVGILDVNIFRRVMVNVMRSLQPRWSLSLEMNPRDVGFGDEVLY